MNPGADAFLDCIMKRSNYDTIVHVWIIAIIGLMLPTFTVIFTGLHINETVTEYLGILSGALLLENLVFNFIIFCVTLALFRHHLRDVMWMDALISYAEGYGLDVGEMKRTRDSFHDTKIVWVMKASMIYLIVLALVTAFAALFVSIKDIDNETAGSLQSTLSTIMLVMLSVSTAYQFYKLRKFDKLQCRFTEIMSDTMKGVIDVEPQGAKFHLISLWPHIALIVATFGLYSLPFSLYIVHCMNVHIRQQHDYEGKLIRLMMEKEGAKGVKRISSDSGSGIRTFLKNFFT